MSNLRKGLYKSAVEITKSCELSNSPYSLWGFPILNCIHFQLFHLKSFCQNFHSKKTHLLLMAFAFLKIEIHQHLESISTPCDWLSHVWPWVVWCVAVSSR